MFRPLVSIITPTYNHERFIGSCIESVLEQTFFDWEQIIIDDGSTDSTPDVVRRYKDPRIRYFRRNHGGLSTLHQIYNQSLELARGEWIAILEGDDFWPKDKLEKQLRVHNSKEVIFSWGKGIVVDQRGRPLSIRKPIRNVKNSLKYFSNSEVLLMMRRDNPFTPSSTIIVNKHEIIKIGGFQPSPSHVYVDLSTWLKLAAHCHGEFCFLNEVLGYWRNHPNQATSFSRVQQLLDHASLISIYKLEGYTSYSKYMQARAALIARNWKEAGRLFSKLIVDRYIERKDRLICLFGFISSLTRVDLLQFLSGLKAKINLFFEYY
jgi:glycosyltransferase involved in cell wall biosynthesis